MKIFLLAALLPLTACSALSTIPTSPGQFAVKTTVDERSLLAVESTYALARIALSTAVDNGLGKNDPALRAQLKDAVLRTYAALQALEDAYKGVNGADWATAKRQFDEGIAHIGQLTGAKK